MPHIESKIPQDILYSAIKSEFLRLASSTLHLVDFIPEAKELLGPMKQEGSQCKLTNSVIRKLIQAHPESFQFSLNL